MRWPDLPAEQRTCDSQTGPDALVEGAGDRVHPATNIRHRDRWIRGTQPSDRGLCANRNERTHRGGIGA